MTMTPEQIKNHIGEVWEDDKGFCRKLLSVDAVTLFYRRDDGECGLCRDLIWLANNNLPQSLRKAKPRMVKAPGWVVWRGITPLTSLVMDGQVHYTRESALRTAENSLCDHVAIQAPGSDEMEVVKGFE